MSSRIEKLTLRRFPCIWIFSGCLDLLLLVSSKTLLLLLGLGDQIGFDHDLLLFGDDRAQASSLLS